MKKDRLYVAFSKKKKTIVDYGLFTYLRKYDIIETCDERVFTEV